MVLTVTFDVDLVGLRSVYELISISNPQLMIEILPLRVDLIIQTAICSQFIENSRRFTTFASKYFLQ